MGVGVPVPDAPVAWTNCLLLWAVRDDQFARGLFLDALTASTAMANRMLLVAV